MKTFFSLVVIFMSCALVSSCTKTDSNLNAPQDDFSETFRRVKVNNGIVSFKSFTDYSIITQHSNEVKQFTGQPGFYALRTKDLVYNSAATNSFSVISNTFDSSLYTAYLLTILNQDKIVEIGSFYVKVDLDNKFCSFINKNSAGAYSELKNDNFDNHEIHVFVDEDEPVLYVLESLENKTITWTQYQEELARKGGGVCFNRGARARQDLKSMDGPYGTFYSNAKYTKGFIHFSLDCNTFQYDKCYGNTLVMEYTFSYDRACKGSNSGGQYLIRGVKDCGINVNIYSAGTALKNIRLFVHSYARNGGYVYNLSLYDKLTTILII